MSLTSLYILLYGLVSELTLWLSGQLYIACLMLGSMTPELHRQFELHYPYDMVQELRSMFEKQAGVEKFDLIQSFHACKQEEGKSVADYVLKMKGYVEQCVNYNMHNMGKTIGEIHAMLIEYEKDQQESLNAKGKNKVNGKGKDKKVYIPKPNNPKPTAKERPAKDDACHHCKEVGHWKRNCPVYLAELQKKRVYKLALPGRSYDGNLTTLPLSFWDYALEFATRNSQYASNKEGSGDVSFVKRDSPVSSNKDLLSVFHRIPKETMGVTDSTSHLKQNCCCIGGLFKKKTDMDGIVHTYKARLVAKGYTQLYGVDYEETFSCSIYMVQPEGFVDPNHPRKVCKLQRSIYGLKQASRSWNKRFDEEIKRFGFTQNLDEPCVYQKASGSNVTFLRSSDDLGEAAFILGIKIYRDRSKRLIGLCQNAYMDKILKRYKMDNSKRGHIPMQERLAWDKISRCSNDKENLELNAIAIGIPELIGWTLSSDRICCSLNGGEWIGRCAKQSTTALYATESEYIAASRSCHGSCLIRIILSQGLFIMANDNRSSERRQTLSKTIIIMFAECVELGEIRILKVYTDNNLADPFTKALSNRKLTKHAWGHGASSC
ncbi:retrotransposon protein, putative, ty1-copia subclass [Tanacetum coccineum]